MSDYALVPTQGYEDDLARLVDFLVEREIASDSPDETVPDRFRSALERALEILTFAPHTCRRCEAAPAWRELVVPFGRSGCVVLFALRQRDVLLLALRGQREEDYR